MEARSLDGRIDPPPRCDGRAILWLPCPPTHGLTARKTTEELEQLRGRLAKMSQADLTKFYQACIDMCQLNRGVAPRASFVQQLVQAWKEMERRRKGKQ